MNEALKKKAISMYKPPFSFSRGYIFDSEGTMFSDDGGSGDRVARIRGWGHIGGEKDFNPENIQDALGEMFAEALNAYWEEVGTL